MINNVDNSAFKQALNKSFKNRIHKDLFHSLANLLTLDYILRLKNTKIIDVHIAECMTRLDKYLAKKIIKDRSFRTVMLLFIIAISPEDSLDKKNNSTRENIAEVVANVITQADFNNYSNVEQEIISVTIRNLITNNSLLDIINFVHTERKLFKEIISVALLNANRKQNNDIITELNIGNLASKSVALNKKIQNYKRNVTNIIAATSVIASLMIAVKISTFLILPAVVVSAKYGAKLGNKLSNKLITYNKAISQDERSISQTKSDIINKMQSLSSALPTHHESLINPKTLGDQELDIIKNRVQNNMNIVQQIDHEAAQETSKQNVVRKKSHKKSRVL